MMKTFFFAVAAVVALTACNKNGSTVDTPEMTKEMSVMAVNQKSMTKGYATGATFEDIAYDEIHAADPHATPRTMMLSTYLTPQNGTPGNYFVAEEFAVNDVDNLWHATPARYWPIGGTLDFLAYSVKNDFAEDKVHWDANNAAGSLSINVTPVYSQDDILFSSVSGRASSTGSAAVPMEFKHAQAWIEFRVCATKADVVMLNEITLENIYDCGDLNIKNNGGDALARWDFREYRSADRTVDDTFEVYGSTSGAPKYIIVDDGDPASDTDWEYLDMLIPEQGKTAIILKYELAGNDAGQQLTYRFDLDNENWLQGKKYVYDITMSVNEITIQPSVATWGEGVVTDVAGDII